jgi:23S rRNA pseudouridine2605 synthase
MVRREGRPSQFSGPTGQRKRASRPPRAPSKPAPGPAFRRQPRRPDDASETAEGGDRLQKVLAAAGVGSRRHCEEMILAGRVEVDGQVVTELGTRVDPAEQDIRVDGETLRKQRKVYYLVNKPPGVLSTNYDQSGRPRVIDLLPESRERLFTVGRLDMSSEGLILVTNDGELANRLTHPRYGVEKTYQVLVAGEFTPEQARVLTKGVHLAEGHAHADRVKVRSKKGSSTLLEIVLSEGRNREIRRLLARVGHKVLRLKRIAIGEVRLADLPLGQYRRLRNEELRTLERPRPKSTKRRKKTPTAGQARPAQAVPKLEKRPPEERRGTKPRSSQRSKPAGRPSAAPPGKRGQGRRSS